MSLGAFINDVQQHKHILNVGVEYYECKVQLATAYESFS